MTDAQELLGISVTDSRFFCFLPNAFIAAVGWSLIQYTLRASMAMEHISFDIMCISIDSRTMIYSTKIFAKNIYDMYIPKFPLIAYWDFQWLGDFLPPFMT